MVGQPQILDCGVTFLHMLLINDFSRIANVIIYEIIQKKNMIPIFKFVAKTRPYVSEYNRLLP